MKYLSVFLIAVLSIFSPSCARKEKTVNTDNLQKDNFKFSLVFYEKYCGPGHPRNTEINPDAADVIDQVCKDHDECYSRLGYFNKDCDIEIASAIFENDLVDFKQKFMGALITTYFSISPSAGDNNFLQLLTAPETIDTKEKSPFKQPVVVVPSSQGPSLGIASPLKFPKILINGLISLFSDKESKEKN